MSDLSLVVAREQRRDARHRAMVALAAGMTIARAASAAGVSSRSVNRWLTRPAYRAALQARLEAQSRGIVAAAQRRGRKMLRLLEDLASHGGGEDIAGRVRAAQVLLRVAGVEGTAARAPAVAVQVNQHQHQGAQPEPQFFGPGVAAADRARIVGGEPR